jgi:DNA polymerase III sliding clamp (beta) subunit (PCNA family)
MQLPDSQIELAASTTESRYTLKAVKFDVEGKRIMATDGHIAAIVPCEPSAEDHSALIPLDAIKGIRAMQKRAKTVPVEVRTNSKITAIGAGETEEYAPMEGQFPNVDMVIPKWDAAKPCTIALDAELLLRLAKALTRKGMPLHVKLYVKDLQSCVVVKATYADEGAVGLIMPVRV